jgi:hypothetical protein
MIFFYILACKGFKFYNDGGSFEIFRRFSSPINLTTTTHICLVVDDFNCFLKKMKSTTKINAATTAEVRPMIIQDSHAGMKVLRYLSDPIITKKAANPINRITRVPNTPTINPAIRSLWRRFLRAISVSRRYSLRIALTSLINE